MTETPHKRTGRPRSDNAASHAAILDAVHDLLQHTSARDLTMEAVARKAGVGKPTLYKWWPSKAALIFAMFHERLAEEPATTSVASAETTLRMRVRRLIGALNGQFGKVMAELIAEGQSDPTVLQELYERHIRIRREGTMAEIERGKAGGEFTTALDAGLLLDSVFGAIYYRLLLRAGPLDEAYGDSLIDLALTGYKTARD